MTAKHQVTEPKGKVVKPDEVDEVRVLLRAEKALQKHIESNPEFYKEFVELVTKRNALVELADAKVREMGVNCGPFILVGSSKDVNIEKLFEELGEAAFKTFGGYTETVTAYKLDRARFLSYADSGAIPKEVLDACVEDKNRYKKVPIYVLP